MSIEQFEQDRENEAVGPDYVEDGLGQDGLQNMLTDAARRLRATRDTAAIAASNERLRKLTIKTSCVCPPIPIRNLDWQAVDDRTYDGPGSPMGTGVTEQEAIDDLLQQLDIKV